MANAPLCPVTGQPMVRDVRPMELSFKGFTTTLEMPGWYCDASGESLHTGDDMKVSDRELRKLKARADDLLSADDIRRIRLVLKLSQREAGTLIGGGPNAFQKYESGDILPSRAISNFLRLLERHPEELAGLRSKGQREPETAYACE